MILLRRLSRVYTQTLHDFKFTALVGKVGVVEVIDDLPWMTVYIIFINLMLRLAIIIQSV